MIKARHYLGMNVYWFGLAFLWNGLHPIILPAVLLSYVPENLKNTYLGGLTFTGLVLAMLIQPLSGALSDRAYVRAGKRRPWILVGTLLSLIILAGMSLSTSLTGIILAYLLLQVASNAAHGPAQGLIPDLVPEERRGLASGVKNLFDMGGLVVTSLVAGTLMGQGDPGRALAITGAVLAVCALITVVSTPEKPPLPEDQTTPLQPQKQRLWGDVLKVDLARHPAFTRLLVARFFILLGIYAVQSFAQYYIRDWLGVPNPAQVTGNLMATIGVTLTLLVFPAGWLSDRIGRQRLNVLAGLLASTGIFLLIFAKSLTSLYLYGALIGMATGIFLSVNWALAIDLAPAAQAGKFLGLTNLATAGAGAASRLAGPMIDSVNALYPGRYWGYPLLFLLGSAVALIGAILLLRLRQPQPAHPVVPAG